MAAAEVKLSLAFLVVFTVRRPQITNTNSICYSFHLEEANDVPNMYFQALFGNILKILVLPIYSREA